MMEMVRERDAGKQAGDVGDGVEAIGVIVSERACARTVDNGARQASAVEIAKCD